MVEHITRLAEDNSVTLQWSRKGWRKAGAWVGDSGGLALVPVIRQPSDYYVALHEIGHIASPEASMLSTAQDLYGHVLCEGAAWAWAAASAKRRFAAEMTSQDWARVSAAIGSHIAWAASQPSRRPRAGEAGAELGPRFKEPFPRASDDLRETLPGSTSFAPSTPEDSPQPWP